MVKIQARSPHIFGKFRENEILVNMPQTFSINKGLHSKGKDLPEPYKGLPLGLALCNTFVLPEGEGGKAI